jgi:GTPase SAR1 family protein
MSYGLWQDFFGATVKTYFPDIAKNFQYVPPILIFIFIAIVTGIVNYFNRDNTAMGKHSNPIEKELPNISYEQEIKGIASSLSSELRDIDIKTNWSSQYFTPLDAEVEVIKGTRREKKIIDLLSAIKKSDDRLFLILGDPGSGKSVSLRKLCQDLSEETKKTGKIPIYINLKEWQIDKKWGVDNPPTTECLMNFVLANIGKGDIFIRKFFNRKIDGQTYFERLYLTGHLFFVFDSFDEIPSVLDEYENSWLIKELSKVIFTFLKGAREDSSQGILASRLFRKPTQEFQCSTTLEIRPFSEKKIVKTLERNGKIDSTIIKGFFQNCSHLIPIARNPFTATLISEYLEYNNGKLPKTHAELYENYVNQLLDDCKDQMRKRCISKEQIIIFAKKIATLMSKSSLGWEIGTQTLRDIDSNADKYIDILKFARIGRGNTGDESVFSFVHRRFAEYLMAKNMLDNKDAIDLQAIPKDSQLRDALVLYCEIADNETAKTIANFCWETIKMNNDLRNMEVIHALRFLRDAFKGRKECLKDFNFQLAEYMKLQITNKNNDMLSIKIIVDCVGLLSTSKLNINILLALELDNYWINETAFYSCRNIPYLTDIVMSKFVNFFNKMPTITLLKSYSDYKFSLSLSESFSNLQFWIKIKLFDFLFMSFAFIIALITIFILFCPVPIYIAQLSSSGVEVIIMFSLYIIISYLSLIISPSFIETFLPKYLNRIVRIVLPICFLFEIHLHMKNASLELIILMVFIILCSMIYPIFRFFNRASVYAFKKFLSLYEKWFYIIGSIVVVGLFSFISVILKYELPKIIFFILFVIIVIMFLLRSLFFSVLKLYKYFSQNKLLKKIDFRSQNSREVIYKQFTAFDNIKVKLKYVNLLELYVHDVSGEWPDKNIFKLTSDPAIIHLAQLEEKWLGINR